MRSTGNRPILMCELGQRSGLTNAVYMFNKTFAVLICAFSCAYFRVLSLLWFSSTRACGSVVFIKINSLQFGFSQRVSKPFEQITSWLDYKMIMRNIFQVKTTRQLSLWSDKVEGEWCRVVIDCAPLVVLSH